MPTDHQILIIDDQPQNLQVLGNLLREHNYKTGFATSGSSALEILNKISFNLILLDVNMPKMDGFEVCKAIREGATNKDTPIIFLTASHEPESIVKGFKAGGQDYVTKPFNNAELISRVETQLALQDKTLQLQELNQNLEKKVFKRTEALSQLSHELKGANDKLKHLDQLKSQFIRLISHELRTPLTGIVGFTEILKKDLLNSEYEEKVNLLSLAVYRLNQLSFKALLVSELEAKEYDIKKSVQDLNLLIHSECLQYSDKISKKHLQLNIQTDTPILIDIDSKIFHYGFSEVLENAIFHSKSESQIRISAQISDQFATVSISNSDALFPDEILLNPFEYFTGSSNHKNKRIGLGLAIAKLMSEAHEGHIKIENSEFGAKVIFGFALP